MSTVLPQWSRTVLHAPAKLAERDLLPVQAVLGAVLILTAVTALDLTDGRIGAPFVVAFLLICLTVPFAVRTGGLFVAAIMPPALMVGFLLLLAWTHPEAIAVPHVATSVPAPGRALAKLLDLGIPLLIGHALAIVASIVRITESPDLQ